MFPPRIATANLLRLLLLPLAMTVHTHSPEGEQRPWECELPRRGATAREGSRLRTGSMQGKNRDPTIHLRQVHVPLSRCLRSSALRLSGGGGHGMAAADAAHLARVNQEIRYALSHQARAGGLPPQACVLYVLTRSVLVLQHGNGRHDCTPAALHQRRDAGARLLQT
jgi:hypothetical protein